MSRAFAGRRSMSAQVPVLQPVRVHRPHPLHALHQQLGPFGDGLALQRVAGGGARQIPAQGEHVERHGDRTGQAEPPVDARHRRQAQHAEQQRRDHVRQHVRDGLADRGDVRADPGQQVAAARPGPAPGRAAAAPSRRCSPAGRRASARRAARSGTLDQPDRRAADQRGRDDDDRDRARSRTHRRPRGPGRPACRARRSG